MSYCRDDGRCEICDPREPLEETPMYDDDTDWDNENELAQERANDPDRQRMDYAHQYGAWGTPEQTAAKQARERELFPEVTR